MKTLATILTIISLFLAQQIFAQKTIKGKVIDIEGIGIPAASVKEKKTKNVTMTDLKGNYIIVVADSCKELEFSAMMMETVTVKIESNIVNVTLKQADVEIECVEVRALGIKREAKVLGYAVTTVAPTGFVRRTAKKLSGKIAGVRTSKGESSAVTSSDYTASSSSEDNSLTKSGLLTAGELNDFGKWELWQDISKNELSKFKNLWKIKPQERYCVQLSSQNGNPIINADVFLKNSKNDILWVSKTDNTGKAELWRAIFNEKEAKSKVFIEIEYQGKTKKIKKPKTFHKGINILSVEADCDIPTEVDIAFVVDATGSMGDEIQYLKAELTDIMTKVKSQYSELDINLGSVFYRDVTDSYLTQKSDFSNDINQAVKFIKMQSAGGGGDFPEAVDAGLDVAINELNWSENARTKIIFLILDAPPHSEDKNIAKIQELIKIASREGIKIVPVTASGINKSTEYLMRSMALATNGTYVFLTDDSGIGGSHIKPTTDEYKVETLNEIFIRLIDQFIKTPTCEQNVDFNEDDIDEVSYIIDNSISDSLNIMTVNKEDIIIDDSTKTDIEILPKGKIKYYPNPTSNILNIEISGKINEMFLADISGKILMRFDTKSKQEYQIQIGEFPSGLYLIQYLSGENWKTGKVILQR